MGKYILKRLAIGILTLFILATITFFLMHAIPGSPFGADNKNLTPEQYAAMEAKYNLDKPLFQQYTTYMVNLLHMDFGESISKKGELVLDIILKRAPVTARLGACAFIISVIVGITLGIVGALTKKKWVNGFITFLAVGPVLREACNLLADGLQWIYFSLGPVGGAIFGFWAMIVASIFPTS